MVMGPSDGSNTMDNGNKLTKCSFSTQLKAHNKDSSGVFQAADASD